MYYFNVGRGVCKSWHQIFRLKVISFTLLDVGPLHVQWVLAQAFSWFQSHLWKKILTLVLGGSRATIFQCSCLENPRDGGAWWAAVYGVAQSRTRLKWLSSSSSRSTIICVGMNRHQAIITSQWPWSLIHLESWKKKKIHELPSNQHHNLSLNLGQQFQILILKKV